MRAWLLDVAGEQQEGGPVIYLWCVKEDSRLLVKYLDFKPYYYLVPPIDDQQMPHSVVERKLRGKPARASLVISARAEYEEEAERLAKKYARTAYEHDIRLAHKFLLSLGLRPSSWVELEAALEGTHDGLELYVAKGKPVNVEGLFPELNVVALEAVIRPERGSPRPDRDPVVQLSLASRRGLERLTGPEDQVLISFVQRIEEENADVVVGFRTKFLLPYLAHRARLLGLRLALGRMGAEPHTSVYGHVSVEGRLAVDLKDLAEEIPEIKLDTLEEMAEYMNLERGLEEVPEVEWYRLAREDPGRASQLCDERARLILRLFEELKDYLLTLSSVTGMPADYVLSASVGFRVENYMMYEAVRRGELIPPRPRRAGYAYEGGFVFEPRPGLYSDVAVIDFKSMYPSIMLKHNVSFDNIEENGEEKPPGLGVGFRRGDAFVPSLLSRLIEARREAEALAQRLPEGSVERRMFEAKQRALKLLANAMYGYLGWPAARWYSVEAARAIAAWGREAITSSAERARELGLEVLYGDTDSLFVKGARAAIEELIRWIRVEMGLEARIDKVYSRLLLTKAKKKYGGLVDDKVEVVGLEAVRGDWCKAARRAQLRVLELVLRDRAGEAAEEARSMAQQVREGKVPLAALVIWEKITRPLEAYQALGAHTKVALEMKREGWDIVPGTIIGYVIAKGKGRVSDRARPYYKASLEDVDLDYYAEKQLLPACERILEAVGLTVSGGKGLLDFR